VGKIEGRRRRGRQRMRWLDGITDYNGHGFGWTPELVLDREAWHAAVHVVTESDTTERLNWTAKWPGMPYTNKGQKYFSIPFCAMTFTKRNSITIIFIKLWKKDKVFFAFLLLHRIVWNFTKDNQCPREFEAFNLLINYPNNFVLWLF